MDHNQQGGGQGRRHFHRGRRGNDRRGQPERRQPNPPPGEPQPQHRSSGDQVDVEQIMRDIRARIAQRHGIELTSQQIQELAARRLEAILDPRTVKPALLDQLRKSAGVPPPADPLPSQVEPAYTFEENTLFESHRGLMRLFRAMLRPILKLFFNPNPLIRALNIQSKLNTDAATREAERGKQQAEWNALHYELLQRVVTESSRLSLEMQALSLRVESLSAKVDFNEQRVRGIEATTHQPQSQPHRAPRSVEPPPMPLVATTPDVPASAPAPTVTATEGSVGTPDGQRRRRRRRRGRRGGTSFGETPPAGATLASEQPDAADQEFEDEGPGGEDVAAEAAAEGGEADVTTSAAPMVSMPEEPWAAAPQPEAAPAQESYAPADPSPAGSDEPSEG